MWNNYSEATLSGTNDADWLLPPAVGLSYPNAN